MGGNIQFSNSNNASFCRSLIGTRDSRLLIVDGGEQAENVRQEMKSRGSEPKLGEKPNKTSLVTSSVSTATIKANPSVVYWSHQCQCQLTRLVSLLRTPGPINDVV